VTTDNPPGGTTGTRLPTELELAEMRVAFEAFRSTHTIDNRTPREIFYNGYYSALVTHAPTSEV